MVQQVSAADWRAYKSTRVSPSSCLIRTCVGLNGRLRRAHHGLASSELVAVDLPGTSVLDRCRHRLLSFANQLALVGLAEAVAFARPAVGGGVLQSVFADSSKNLTIRGRACRTDPLWSYSPTSVSRCAAPFLVNWSAQ